jgi:phage tail tube protein FII
MQHFSTNRIATIESANLFVGDHDPSASNHLTIANLKLPEIAYFMVDHAAGGAPIAVEVPVIVGKLVASFRLVGVQPAIMAIALSGLQVFTGYAVIRDRMSGRAREAKVIFEGYLGRADPEQFEKGSTLVGIEYEIRGILHYDLTVAGQRVYFWDFVSRSGRTGDYGQTMRQAPFGFSLEDRTPGRGV